MAFTKMSAATGAVDSQLGAARDQPDGGSRP